MNRNGCKYECIPTYEKFKTRFPSIPVSEEQYRIFLEEATLFMGNPSAWYEFYELAKLYLIAHIYKTNSDSEASVEGGAGISGPIVRTDVADVVVEGSDRLWSKLSPEDAYWYSTIEGQNFMRYCKICFSGPWNVEPVNMSQLLSGTTYNIVL